MYRTIWNGIAAVSVAAGIALLSTAAGAEERDLRVFKDWLAGCDNLKHCAALSLPDDGDDPIAYLRLDRAAGPEAATELVLRLLGDWKTAPMPVELKLDGNPFSIGGKAVQAGSDSETLSVTFQPAEIEAFLKSARKATELTVDAGGRTAHISLSGSVAAMLWIDERQGRLDTMSALVRKGSKADVPAALALPVVTAKAAGGTLSEADAKALTMALRTRLAGEDVCEDDEALIASDAAWALDDKRRLVGLGCSSGAYNLTTGFWILEGDDVAAAQPVVFPNGESEYMENMLVNATFESKTGRLDFFSRGRGIGDCGAIGSYAWTGAAFVQTGFSMMGECRGIGPDDWIPLYRSTIE